MTYTDWEMQEKVQKLPNEFCYHCGKLVDEVTPCFYDDDEYYDEWWCCEDCVEGVNNLLMVKQ